jgi:hypothetical protein
MALFLVPGATLAAWRTLTLYQSKDELAGARTGISSNSSVLHELQGRHNDVAGFWNSQAGQDCVIQGMFGRAEDGVRPRYFVDLAANHAIHLSNTRALERDHGWHGVCIEGNEALAFELLRTADVQLSPHLRALIWTQRPSLGCIQTTVSRA